MTISKLKKSDIKFFSGMDPNGLLQKLSVPGTVAFGASKEDITGNVPSGLMILSEVYGRLTIEWIYVHPLDRYKGVGEALLIRAFECADRLGYKQLSAIISEGNLREGEMNFVQDYFEDRLFCTQQPFFGEFILTAADLKKSSFIKKDLSMYSDLSSLKDAKGDVLKALMSMSDGSSFLPLYPLKGMGKLFDMGLSSVLVDDGEVYGALIFQKIEDAYVMVLLFAEDEKSKEIMLIKSMSKIAKEKNSSAELQILCLDRNLSELLEKHFPGNKSQIVLLTADIGEYQKLLDD